MFRAMGFLLIGLLIGACSKNMNESVFNEFKTQKGVNDSVYLAAGGGYKPYGSQVVLETNMNLFDKVAAKYDVVDDDVTRLFGGGNDQSIKDVLIANPDFKLDEKLFAHLFSNSKCPECSLRHNSLKNLDGNSTKSSVSAWLDVASEELESDDKMGFYYTGHGSHEKDRYDQNYLALWRSQLSVQDFSESLDGFDKKTQVQVVMVQCFSGGFTQMNYAGGDIDAKELSSSNRCGFFSQIAERPAAGCSSDINKREEYSPYFFSAYFGKDESGAKVDADFNRDGKITSNEAHAYVIIHEDSFDVPITTSSQLLRDQKVKVPTRMSLFSWSDLVDDFDDVDLKIINSLASELGYELRNESHPLRFIKNQIKKAAVRNEKATDQADKAFELYEDIFDDIQGDLADVHPIFSNVYGANHNGKLILDEGVLTAVRNALLKHPLFADYKASYLNQKIAFERADDWERYKVKWERLEYLVETKLLEKVLKKDGSAEVQKRYAELKSCEASSFF